MPDLWRLSATEIANVIRTKQYSALEAIQAHLTRLDDVNPAINAVVQECPEEALAAAQRVDAKIAQGEDPGILAGVPITIKVNVDQEGCPTTNGLRLQSKVVLVFRPVCSLVKMDQGFILGC